MKSLLRYFRKDRDSKTQLSRALFTVEVFSRNRAEMSDEYCSENINEAISFSDTIDSKAAEIQALKSKIKDTEEILSQRLSVLQKARDSYQETAESLRKLRTELKLVVLVNDIPTPLDPSLSRKNYIFDGFAIELIELKNSVHLIIVGEEPREFQKLLEIDFPPDIKNLSINFQYLEGVSDDGGFRNLKFVMKNLINRFNVVAYHCTPIIMDNFNRDPQLILGGAIESFFAPYFCEKCEREYNKFIYYKQHEHEILRGRAPQFVCECKETLLCDAGEAYFQIFIRLINKGEFNGFLESEDAS